MFGIGLFEIVIILIVAVIFLGPDKLPKAIVDAVRFFKAIKKTIDETKQTINKEINISHLKQEALEYRHNFEHNIKQITKDIQLQEVNDMFEEYKQLPQSLSQNLESKTTESKILESSAKESKNIKPKELGAKSKTKHKTKASESKIDSKSKSKPESATKTTSNKPTSESGAKSKSTKPKSTKKDS